jgi:hypothetical protein
LARRAAPGLSACAVLAAAIAAATVAGPVGAQDPPKRPVVTGAVQVTSNPNNVRAHITPQIARNPKSGELVIAEVDGRGTRECAVHISVDDGRSWFPGGGFMQRPYTDCSIGAEFGPHAIPFFDDEGVLYVAFSANDPARLASSDRPTAPNDFRDSVPRNAYLAKSTDGGRTFTTHLVYAGPEGDIQKGYVYAPVGAVDAKNPRYVYMGWGQGDWTNPNDPVKAMFAASSDGGRTWSQPIDVSDRVGSDHPWMTVDRNGTVHVVYWSRGFGQPLAEPNLPRPTARKDPVPIYHARSTDHGKTWTRQVLDPGAQRNYRAPVVAAAPNSDHVYAVWHATADPMNWPLSRDGKDRADIFLRSSADGGRTWSERRVVNDDPNSGVNHELPGLSVAPNGRVDVAWHDFRNSPRTGASPGNDTGIQDIWYASSTDNGRTFTGHTRISDRSIDRSIGVYANPIGAQLSVGIASANDAVYFAWQDSRNGRPNTQSEDVYSASLRLDGPVRAAAAETAEGPPDWALLGAGLAAGLGLAMVVVWAFTRRSRPGPVPQPA